MKVNITDTATGTLAVAQALGWRIDGATDASLIAQGAANALAAVAAQSRESLFDTEPGCFLDTLESLARVEPADDR
ncbi:MAG: hypothetical protein JJU27_10620 [Gammaproteobacteria bacterium]|nr:hypothetical protein [Gammaproteobacteria bacterium]